MFPFLSVAIAAGRRLAHRLFDGKDDLKLDYENIPSVVFSHPPVGKFISALEIPVSSSTDSRFKSRGAARSYVT